MKRRANSKPRWSKGRRIAGVVFLLLLVALVVGALGCLGFLSAGQGVMHTGSPQALSMHWPASTQTRYATVA